MVDLEDRLRMIEYAAARIKAAGFRLAYTSMQTEACYYNLPPREGVLRIAAHRYSRNRDKAVHSPVLANLTFGENFLPKTEQSLDKVIAAAVGTYMIADGKGTARWRKTTAIRTTALTVSL